MGASLIMATVKAALPFLAAGRSVAETLREANRRIAPRLAPREFVALAYLRYEPDSGAFALGNAGLPDPYRVSDGAAQVLSVPGPRFPLGVRAEVAYEEIRGTLAAGEKLVFVTDGLPEAPDPSGEPLGYVRFEALLPGAPDPTALFAAVRAAAAPGLEDDWTAVYLERRPLTRAAMDRDALLDDLSRYAAADALEEDSVARIRTFVAGGADPFSRATPEGHVTGSAVVSRPDGSAFLLVLHRRLSRWLQPGGHTEDADASVFDAAVREACEETGIAADAFRGAARARDPRRRRPPDPGARRGAPRTSTSTCATSSRRSGPSTSQASEDPSRPMRWASLEEAVSLGIDASLERALRKARAARRPRRSRAA